MLLQSDIELGSSNWNTKRKVVGSNDSLKDVNLKRIHLEDFNFRDMHFASCDFNFVMFVRCNFADSILRKCSFTNCRFTECSLSGINCQNSSLSQSTVEGCVASFAKFNKVNLDSFRFTLTDCKGSKFSHSNMHACLFNSCNLYACEFGHANLMKSTFNTCEMTSVSFKRTNLREATIGSEFDLKNGNAIDLQDVVLADADLRDADLRGAANIPFDSNPTDGTRLPHKCYDRWSVLRSFYSGPMFFVHMVLLIVAILPYFIKATLYYHLSEAPIMQSTSKSDQIMLWRTFNGMQTDSEGMDNSEVIKKSIDSLINSISNHVPDSELAVLSNLDSLIETSTDRTGAFIWKPYRIYAILLGAHVGWWQVVTSLIFLIYYILRGILTYRVSLMREKETRSNITPAQSDYIILHNYHKIIKVLMIVCAVLFTIRMYEVLWHQVDIPKRAHTQEITK